MESAATSYAESWTDWCSGAERVLDGLVAMGRLLDTVHGDLTQSDLGARSDLTRLAGEAGLMFEVDLDLLDETVAQMTRCGEGLDDLLDEVSRRVAELHLTWTGAAAIAQDSAQAEWEAGFRAMRTALAVMRADADIAHGHYSAASATNLRMWEQVR